MKIYHNLLNNYQTSTANDRTKQLPCFAYAKIYPQSQKLLNISQSYMTLKSMSMTIT